MKKRVVIFGIFDKVHDGHRDLFGQALRQAQGKLSKKNSKEEVELLVIVGRDEIAEKLKGKRPKHKEDERLAMLEKEELVSDAVLGDKELSSYEVLKSLNPNIICVGYDQEDLEQDLRKWVALRQDLSKDIEIHRAKPYKEGILHNSLF